MGKLAHSRAPIKKRFRKTLIEHLMNQFNTNITYNNTNDYKIKHRNWLRNFSV